MKRRQAGFTLLEMLVTATILAILASAVVPMASKGIQRQKELELRRNLREMRLAIDAYKAATEQQKIKAPPVENAGYPESLEILVEGVPALGKSNKVRFLRRIPVDPFTGQPDWGIRSITDDPDSTNNSSGCVFDVYSKAQGRGMNGTPYKEW